MLRTFLRLLGNQRPKLKTEPELQGQSANRMPVRLQTQPSHRERLLSMKIEHAQLCSPRRASKLAEAGIVLLGDLASCDPVAVAQKMAAPDSAANVLRRYRRAIRLAARVPGLMPRDADLLIHIHRASVRAIANESPATLRRDLERFAFSSRGQKLLGKRRLPSLRKVKSWVSVCRAKTVPTLQTESVMPQAA